MRINKILIISATLLWVNLSFAQTKINIPKDLEIELEQAKLNCNEFRPNLITKFVWREGKTRSLLYKKCLDQISDDENYNKFNELNYKNGKIEELSSNVDGIKTRLTFFTLANSMRMLLSEDKTNEATLEIAKKTIAQFKDHYKKMKVGLDKEINNLANSSNQKTERAKELIDIIVTSEEELDKNIDKTLKYIDFILKDYNNYVLMHDKFFPKIYLEPEYFFKSKVSKEECEFLKLNFEEDWLNVKNKLKISCVNNLKFEVNNDKK